MLNNSVSDDSRIVKAMSGAFRRRFSAGNGDGPHSMATSVVEACGDACSGDHGSIDHGSIGHGSIGHVSVDDRSGKLTSWPRTVISLSAWNPCTNG